MKTTPHSRTPARVALRGILEAVLLLTAATFTHAQKINTDVHVRVSPDVRTGIESNTEYPTIQMAMDHAPDAGPGRVFVHIAPGIYHERVIVTQLRPRMTLIGTGSSPADVVITNSLNAKIAGGTYFTETVEINAPEFEADNLTIVNTAGNTGQAVAAAVRSDRAIFKHVRFLGHQDTLFADFGRQYYTACYIAGGVDFIFGNATAVFDHSEIHALAPGYLTAQSRISPTQTTGFVIANSRVTSSIGDATDLASRHTASGPNPAPAAISAASANGAFALGRPWRPFSRVVFLNTELPADLNPAGWTTWTRHADEKIDAFYAEYNSKGPGASSKTRVAWSHQLTAAESRPYQPANFLRGHDNWNPEAEAAQLP